MTPDTWIKYTLGGAVVVAFGIVGKMVVERIARWVLDWLGRVNDGLAMLAEMKEDLAAWIKRAEGWDIHGLRNQVNVSNLRNRVTEARVQQLDRHVQLIRVALDKAEIEIPPPPPLEMRLSGSDRETIEILLRLAREQED